MKGTVMDAKTYKKTIEKVFMGKKVRTLIKMQNGFMVIPEGSICTITRKYQGFNLTSEPCEHCGVRIRISRVHRRDVDLV
jgi:hypothetical protein